MAEGRALGAKNAGSKAAAAMEQGKATKVVVTGMAGGWMTAKDFCKVFPVTEATIINRKKAAEQALKAKTIQELPAWIRKEGGVWPIPFAKEILEEGLRNARGPDLDNEAQAKARIASNKADQTSRIMQAVAGSTVFREDVVDVLGGIASEFDSVTRSWPKTLTDGLLSWLATDLRSRVADVPGQAEERKRAVTTVMAMIDKGSLTKFLASELDKRIADVGVKLAATVRTVVARGKARAEKMAGIR